MRIPMVNLILSTKGAMEIMKLFMTKDEDLYMTRPLKMYLMMKSLIQRSGCTGEPCLPLKTGTVHWK